MIDKKLQAVIARILTVAMDGIGLEQDAVARAIQQYEGQAIPLLLSYLKHPNPGVRQVVAYTLAFINGLNESHLDALLAVKGPEKAWLPTAIARIGTPRAIAVVTADLQSSKSADSQAAYGFEILGKKGVPILCQLLRSAPVESDDLRQTVVTIIGRLDDEAKRTAIHPLLDIATNKRVLAVNRQSALLGLGKSGATAKQCIPVMEQLVRQEPAVFRDTFEKAIVAMNDPGSVPRLIQHLKKNRNDFFQIPVDMRDLEPV